MPNSVTPDTSKGGFRLAAIAVLALASLLGPCVARGDDAGITLNFKDADIREVAATIGQITHKNFIIDPRVQGRVTVVSSRPISADAVYAAFLSVLEVHGLAAAPAGQVIKIVPSLEARQMPGPAFNAETPGDAVVTEVLQITNVSATQLVPVLRPLMSTEAQLAAYPQANVLIVSDRASNVTRLLDIIQRIDQATDNDVEVIPLQNAPAADVVQVLNTLMQADASGQNGAPLKLVADERTNSILVSGDKGQRLRIRALTAHLDMPLETGNTQVVYLRYAKAKDVSDELKGYVTDLTKQGGGKAGAAGAAGGGGIDISVIPDDRTNALVITAPPKAMRSVQDVIGKLDIRRAQVLVQAIQAELTSDKSAELGVTWVADAANNGAVGLTDFSNTGAGIVGVGQAALAAANSGSTGTVGTNFAPPQGLTLGVGKIASNGFSFAGLLRALAGDADTNILSTPSVVTLDNEEATIKVTQKVPFVTGQYTNASTGAAGSTGGAVINPFQTVDRQDVGITLKITPQINEGDSVLLKIDQSVSNLTGNSIGGQPVTNEREINTSILAKSGEIVVLGGLIDHDLIESEQRVPILGSIPLIGNLFKYRTTTNTKRNLMVFLQPTILRDSDSSKYYTNDRYNYFRDLQLKNQSPVQLMPGSDRPLLDELKNLDKTAPAAVTPPAAATAAAPAAATVTAPAAPAAAMSTTRPAQAAAGSLPAGATAAAAAATIPPATPAPTAATTTKAPGIVTARTPSTAAPTPATTTNPPHANPDAAANHGPEDRRG
ncbi:MAG TPA: type II secretion system secretin GspD [Gammaproteobacteria bacterium]|nr:type II secretion system secretin GspD [Gammaproteobacteria bacterium]